MFKANLFLLVLGSGLCKVEGALLSGSWCHVQWIAFGRGSRFKAVEAKGTVFGIMES